MNGPWPRVNVGGRLESAEMEWLHTNGAGAYSMSTVALRHTRRYHGLLVAALSPPIDRHVVVSHLETAVVVDGRSFRLSVLQSPDAAPTPGYRFLESFEQDPLPRFTYRLGRARFEQKLCLARGENAIVCAYTWHGKQNAALRLRPLLPFRRIHTLTHEHGGMMQRVRMHPGEVDIQPISTLPRVVFGHTGVFIGSPEWYRRLEYPEDKLRRAPAEEDLWTPGSFELSLSPGQTTYFTMGIDRLPELAPEQILTCAVAHFRAQDPGDERPSAVRELSIAAEQFCADSCDRPSVVAGYPWLTALSRDELISLCGLYLVRGRSAEACRVLGTMIDAMTDDLVPRRVRSVDAMKNPPAPDATLWMFDAARHLTAARGPNDPFIRETLYPALVRIFRRVSAPGKSIVGLSPDGLIWSADDEVAFTWMNIHTGATTAATPRRGSPVELQALWTGGCQTLSALSAAYGDADITEAATRAREKTRAAFAKRFWCEATRYPYDCLRSVDDADGPIMDSAIRPYALVALDVDADLFERWQAQSIVDRVRERLLTVRGIRSLDPNQPGYRGEYEGTFEERAVACHQGLAWTHLLGAYARTSLRLQPDDFDLQEDLRVRIEEARVGGPLLGQVSQFADGEPPHRAGGCPAQATSVAELLRTLVWDLGL